MLERGVFEKAREDASSYQARQEYLGALSRGAEAATELHRGLKEGVDFYAVLLSSMRQIIETVRPRPAAPLHARGPRCARPPQPPACTLRRYPQSRTRACASATARHRH